MQQSQWAGSVIIINTIITVFIRIIMIIIIIIIIITINNTTVFAQLTQLVGIGFLVNLALYFDCWHCEVLFAVHHNRH